MILERSMSSDWLSNTYLVAAEPGGDAFLVVAAGVMMSLDWCPARGQRLRLFRRRKGAM